MKHLHAILTAVLLLACILLLTDRFKDFLAESSIRNLNLRKNQAGAGPAADVKGRYIFVDLGANRADTLRVFLQWPNSKFNYTFAAPPDGRSPDQAEIFLFEANVSSSNGQSAHAGTAPGATAMASSALCLMLSR